MEKNNTDPNIQKKWLARKFKLSNEEYKYCSSLLNNFIHEILNFNITKIIDTVCNIVKYLISTKLISKCHVF